VVRAQPVDTGRLVRYMHHAASLAQEGGN
jgi:hypothetical protein